MPHFTYILQCSDGSLYTGATSDIEKRLIEHNTSKRGARYTKQRRPVVLVYKEMHRTLSKALKREAEIKGWTRAHKLLVIASHDTSH